MTKFLLAVRKAYDSKRIAFVIAFCAIAVFLYFAPMSLAYIDTGYLSLFGEWFTINKYGLDNYATDFALNLTWSHSWLSPAAAAPNFSSESVLFLQIFSTITFVIALVCCFISLKFRPSVMGVLLFGSTAFCKAAVWLPLSFSSYGLLIYAILYMLLCLVSVLAVVLILLATYLPLKEPAPAEPKPERKRKPSKAERIAELEARVRELEEHKKD